MQSKSNEEIMENSSGKIFSRYRNSHEMCKMKNRLFKERRTKGLHVNAGARSKVRTQDEVGILSFRYAPTHILIFTGQGKRDHPLRA